MPILHLLHQFRLVVPEKSYIHYQDQVVHHYLLVVGWVLHFHILFHYHHHHLLHQVHQLPDIH